jgi:hypothetical protein
LFATPAAIFNLSIATPPRPRRFKSKKQSFSIHWNYLSQILEFQSTQQSEFKLTFANAGANSDVGSVGRLGGNFFHYFQYRQTLGSLFYQLSPTSPLACMSGVSCPHHLSRRWRALPEYQNYV